MYGAIDLEVVPPTITRGGNVVEGCLGEFSTMVQEGLIVEVPRSS